MRARELGYEALALTDHDGLYGAMEFARAAHAWGIQPITGAEVTLAPPLPPAAGNKEQGTRSKGRDGDCCSEAQGYHLPLLCESQRGYASLCRLLSHAHLDHE